MLESLLKLKWFTGNGIQVLKLVSFFPRATCVILARAIESRINCSKPP